MIKKFIERPVLSTVISIIILILGILGIIALPITQYPEIAPPTVQVSASYPGADAETVLKSVVTPLEEQINGVDNMIYINSTASNNGTASISVYFELGTDPDIAAVNVQNRVSRATSLLPEEVVRSGVTTTKQQTSMLMIFSIYSPDDKYGEAFLDNYAKINLVPQIQRVNGVGQAHVYGTGDYAMRIWLKPDVMSQYGLVPSDIRQALNDQNLEAAPGEFGRNGKHEFEYTIKYSGRLDKVSQYKNIIVRTTDDGDILRLKDVANIELGSQSYNGIHETNGHPSASVAIYQSAGSNAREVIQRVKQVVKDTQPNFPPGMTYTTLVDTNLFLNASISKVIETLLEAFILVFIVVFVFLQDFRSTLIPAITVPVSIVGTFFFLNLFGFTINLLTLFALVLAIGMVVDDAIVVVEAVHAKLDEGETSAKKATVDAMHEITGAIISITLVMSAVFIPVTFLGGSTGVFFQEFGITMAIAILISAANALTLSPALCALFLKPEKKGPNGHSGLIDRFHHSFNVAFKTTLERYQKVLEYLTSRKWITIAAVVVFTLVFWGFLKYTPTGFVPQEDQGFLFTDIQLAPASSLQRTKDVVSKLDSLTKSIPEIKTRLSLTGRSLISGAGSSYGFEIYRLKNWDKRTGENQDIKSVIAKLNKKAAQIKGAKIRIFAPPSIPGFGQTGGFTMHLQDRSGGSFKSLDNMSHKFIQALMKQPEIAFATTSFSTDFPQYQINVDVAKCKKAGIGVRDLLTVLQGYYGGVYASDFNRFGKQYRVMIKADRKYRASKASLSDVYVKNNQGEMAPVNSFVDLKKVYGPQSVSRFNLYNAVSINGSPAPGYSSGDALDAIARVADQVLPTQYSYDYSGTAREEQANSGQAAIIFALSVIFIYFLLSAQYESYLIPFSVLLPLPIGLSGSFLFANMAGIANNIYLQISLVMLVGLLAKNAILVVEFALQRRQEGMGITKAAIRGAKVRLRPILMTSFAFIFGLLPLALSSGVAANSNQSIGLAAIGGMFIGTIIGIFVIPTLFIIFQNLQEKITGVQKR